MTKNSTKPKNVFLYLGGTQFENVGDLLINRSLLYHIANYGEILLLEQHYPADYLKALVQDIPNVKILTAFPSRKQLFVRKWRDRQTICRLETPGHVFDTNWMPQSNWKSKLVQFVDHFVLGIRKIRFGVTLGPFASFNEQFYIDNYKSYRLLCVRDKPSLEWCVRHGIKNSFYIPDLAWGYPTEVMHLGGQPPKQKKNQVLLSFRGNLIGTELDMPYLQQIIQALEYIMPLLSGCELVLVQQVDFDLSSNTYIWNHFKGRYAMRLVTETYTLDGAVSAYAEAPYVLTNRLHVFLLALKAGSFPITVTDTERHPKLVNQLREQQLEHLLVDVREGQEAMQGKMRFLLEHTSALADKHKHIEAKNKKKIFEKFKKINAI
ncbi:MAG: polysaccharide pyruvyl transferase family protein [Chitinophagaceae bacterium]